MNKTYIDVSGRAPTVQAKILRLLHERGKVEATIISSDSSRALAGCGGKHVRPAAAFKIVLTSEADRTVLLSVIEGVSREEGLRLEVSDSERLKQNAAFNGLLEQSVHASVTRQASDRLEAVLFDERDYLGRVWITFLPSDDPVSAKIFRERLVQKVRLSGLETLELPIMPNGSLPQPADLNRTPDGYAVSSEAESKYYAR
ncbi:MAG: hypothetical protein EON93_02335 [Burkholderiales bacterium]|nr:MAG: hypothetical protein EON93_02335 [Burkholderiales bacterium]